jgi:hypothetical protein
MTTHLLYREAVRIGEVTKVVRTDEPVPIMEVLWEDASESIALGELDQHQPAQ